MLRISSLIAVTAIVSTPALSLAGSYQALCAGTKCTVVVGPDNISSPYGSIPTNRVTNWGGGGDTSTQVGTGVATTVLFGPIGLLGFLAKKHDFNFVVNGYDADGKKASISLQFKNDKPAKRFINEMQQVTQLGMGQTRSAKEILAAESEASALSTGTLEGDAQLQEQNLNNNADLTASSNANCWSNYLDQNPAMKEWAHHRACLLHPSASSFCQNLAMPAP